MRWQRVLSARMAWVVVLALTSLQVLAGCRCARSGASDCQSCGVDATGWNASALGWLRGGCENCDNCRPRLFTGPNDSCGPCESEFASLFQWLGFCCRDPRLARGAHGQRGHHARRGHYEPYHAEDRLSPWSASGPGSFHPVPTRPVFGPQPTPADPIPHSDEGPSDAGLESIPLRDMPRNLDTPNDPRNFLPPVEDVVPDDIPSEGEIPGEASSGKGLKFPVQQTGWRSRTP